MIVVKSSFLTKLALVISSVPVVAGSLAGAADAASGQEAGKPVVSEQSANKLVANGPVASQKQGGLITPEQFPIRFVKGDYQRIYNQLSSAFQKAVPLQQFTKLAADFNKGVKKYKQQAKLPLVGAARYVWVDDQNRKGVLAVFDKNNTIQSLGIVPLTVYPQTDRIYTKTQFRLPFKGEWLTFWGGTNELVNYHYAWESQRYAYDFLVHKQDRSYQGDPAKNQSYYAFGQEVLAPAAGKVVKVENGIKDNEPVGKMNESQPAGNYVVIDHGNGEYSLLAHFQYNSIKVKAGDQVKEGDVLGLCGNSGISSEPHIHFQVSDSPDLFEGKSIHVRFKHYREIVQGQLVKPLGKPAD